MKAISNISKVSGKTTRVKSGWIMKAIARYLDEVGEATAMEIKSHAKSKGSKSRLTGLTSGQISARLRVHKSFVGEDKYCDRSRKKIKHWRLADRELIE
jgi:hypothetical protein